MHNYYDKNLSAERLRKVYEVAPPRTRQYLQAEIDFVLDNLSCDDSVLELGCGYGRVLKSLAGKAKMVFGIDNSQANITDARDYLRDYKNILLFRMNAIELGFGNEVFDKVICIQNGISAFHVDPLKLMGESIRVAKNGGLILFSSYSEKFWEHRLRWFEIQSELGLVGEIDWEKTKNGILACKDGFSATTYGPGEFDELATQLGRGHEIHEIDESSLFCLMHKTGR